MFSSRFDWDLRPNRLARLLEQKRRSKAAILDLTQSNPTEAGLTYPVKEILQALADERSLVYEPSPAGLSRARQAVAAHYGANPGMSCQRIEPERILLTASTSEAYSYLFKLLADPGDEILVPRPSYPLFGYLTAAESLRAVQYSLTYDGEWALNFGSLVDAVTPRTRAIVIVNPNNPTGSFIKQSELEKLLSLCVEQNLAIVSDEVFADYRFAPDQNSAPRAAAGTNSELANPPGCGRIRTLTGVQEAPTFCLSGLSKIAGLPQMKLAWIVIGGPPAFRQGAFERLELIADTYLSVATPVQHALARLLEASSMIREQIASRVRENLGLLQSAAGRDSFFSVLNVEGGWYAILKVPRTRSEEEWCLELLERDDVLVQPGFFYDFDSEAFLVLSLLPQPEIFREGVRRLLSCRERLHA